MEVLVVGLLAIALLAVGAVTFIPWPVLFDIGTWLILGGFAFGVPTGVIYHVLLWRVLAPRDELPKGWIWRPFDYTDRMTRGEKRWVLPWASIGAVGFVAIILGIGAIVISMLVAVART